MSTFGNEILARDGEQKLIELTNDLPGETTVDEVRLGKACDDAEGKFVILSGIVPDVNNKSHNYIMMIGIRYFLELYKDRNSAVTKDLDNQFFKNLLALKDGRFIEPAGSNNFVASTVALGTLPDMDSTRGVFSSKASRTNPENTIGG